MPSLRILHVSDLHIGDSDTKGRLMRNLSIYEPLKLKAIAKMAYEWNEEFNAILISGDLSNICRYDDLRAARDFIDLPADLLSDNPWLNSGEAPTLKAYKKNIFIVPGNHDRITGLRGFPGKLFDKVFSSYWDVGTNGVKEHYLPNDESPMLAVLCADFSLTSKKDSTVRFGKLGQGKVYEPLLSELITNTKRGSSPNYYGSNKG